MKTLDPKDFSTPLAFVAASLNEAAVAISDSYYAVRGLGDTDTFQIRDVLIQLRNIVLAEEEKARIGNGSPQNLPAAINWEGVAAFLNCSVEQAKAMKLPIILTQQASSAEAIECSCGGRVIDAMCNWCHMIYTTTKQGGIDV